MYIKKLSLINFQKHANLQIDFCQGVNILYGSSDAGKSCIRRAIEWLVQNESIDGIRKTGTKKTSVTIILDNDVEIERVRSQSINRYVIREDGEEKVFDSIGKSIPEDVKELLTIYPIEVDGEEIYLNSQPQIALPFLFDKSPSFRMKLFNKLTGNDVLDKLFGQFNKDILRIKRGYKEEAERFEERATELREKEKEKEKAEAVHIRLKIRVEKIKKLYEKYSKLLELKELEEKVMCNLQETKYLLKTMKFPEDADIKRLKEKIDQFDSLKTLKNSHEKLQTSLGRVRGQLSEMKPASIDISALNNKISRFDRLKDYKNELDKNKDMRHTLKDTLKDTIRKLGDDIKYYKDLLKESKYCPICKQEMTEDCIKEIKL